MEVDEFTPVSFAANETDVLTVVRFRARTRGAGQTTEKAGSGRRIPVDGGYLPSAMTATPAVLSVRRCLMAWYSGDSYQASAADLVANLNTTVPCPADPSRSSESRSMTMFSAPWASRTGPTAATYSRYSAGLLAAAISPVEISWCSAGRLSGPVSRSPGARPSRTSRPPRSTR